jgi:nitrile hydratase
MNGPHDLGGQMGFGPVNPETDEPVFHAAWERRALALTLATGTFRAWTIDESRHMRESMHPADYYSSSYYEIWIKAVEKLLVRHGFVTAEELAAGRKLEDGARPARVITAGDVGPILARGGPTDRAVAERPRFQQGDRVRTKVMHPTGHVRLPRYARGKVGTIEALHGGHVFPDTNSCGKGENPQHLYTVVFDGREIWGPESDGRLKVSIDAWESYLEPC